MLYSLFLLLAAFIILVVMDVRELKHVIYLLLLGCCLLGLMSVVVHKKKADSNKEIKYDLTKTIYIKPLNNEEYLGSFEALDKHSKRQALRNLKRSFLKKYRKKAKKNPPGYGEKSQLTAFLLCVMLGIFGAHRFYTGQTGWGVLQLCTLGCCGVFVIIDLVLIVVGKIYNSDGEDLIPW